MQIRLIDSLTKGVELAKDFLYEEVDNKTVLFLSGGKTPKVLYQTLANEEILKPGAVAMIDERFGEKLHEMSNEKMFQDTNLLSYFAKIHVPFYPMIQDKKTLTQLVKIYDKTLRDLFFSIHKSVGVLGIGPDGHIAGIPSQVANIKGKRPIVTGSDFVASYNVKDAYAGFYGPRLTLTFAGLALLDKILVFVFGADKKKALQAMFESGLMDEIPARFLTTSEISKKVTIITDQKM